MARYIDADKFIKQFERALEHQQKYGLYNHAKLTECVIKAIENEPTADVVPRSEVDKLIGKFECFLCHVTGSRLSKHTYDLRTMETVATDCINETYNDGYGEGYKECAREIIKDLEKLLQPYETEFKRGNVTIDNLHCYPTYKGYSIPKYEVDAFLAELKKKYTEGKDE